MTGRRRRWLGVGGPVSGMIVAAVVLVLLGETGCTVILPMVGAAADAARHERKPPDAFRSLHRGQAVTIGMAKGGEVTGLFMGAVGDSTGSPTDSMLASAPIPATRMYKVRTDWKVVQLSENDVTWVRPHHFSPTVPILCVIGLAIDAWIISHIGPWPSD